MQYTLIDLLNKKHVLIGVEATDAQDAIAKLTAVLVETDHVTPEFAVDVWEREKNFPTGLPTQPLAVAIPHADPDHVNKSAVCVGVLRSPVRFAQMGTDGSTVLDIPIIFLLAIKEKEKQVEMLQQLVAIIQSPELLDGLSMVASPSEAIDIIKNLLARG